MAQWPPPPDLGSLKELIAAADPEGFLADGGPADEYDVEAEELHDRLGSWTIAELTAERILPVVEDVWAVAFSLDGEGIEKRRPALQQLAAQIARFFGPGAQPQVRGSN